MKILEKEISLRDETRAEEQARDALTAEAYAKRVEPLAVTQSELTDRVAQVLSDIKDLPDGTTMFAKEIALLSRVEQVMDEATELLSRPETGPTTIAAETEAIELLLMSKRINPKGGGGGGGSSPGGGGTGTTEQSALALLGSGAEKNAGEVDREVTQSTGITGSELPAEFRSGLDAYFGALEVSQGD